MIFSLTSSWLSGEKGKEGYVKGEHRGVGPSANLIGKK